MLTVSQERGFGSNHLVFLKARPQHAMGRWELRIRVHTLQYTRLVIFACTEVPVVSVLSGATGM